MEEKKQDLAKLKDAIWGIMNIRINPMTENLHYQSTSFYQNKIYDPGFISNSQCETVRGCCGGEAPAEGGSESRENRSFAVFPAGARGETSPHRNHISNCCCIMQGVGNNLDLPDNLVSDCRTYIRQLVQNKNPSYADENKFDDFCAMLKKKLVKDIRYWGIKCIILKMKGYFSIIPFYINYDTFYGNHGIIQNAESEDEKAVLQKAYAIDPNDRSRMHLKEEFRSDKEFQEKIKLILTNPNGAGSVYCMKLDSLNRNTIGNEKDELLKAPIMADDTVQDVIFKCGFKERLAELKTLCVDSYIEKRGSCKNIKIMGNNHLGIVLLIKEYLNNNTPAGKMTAVYNELKAWLEFNPVELSVKEILKRFNKIFPGRLENIYISFNEAAARLGYANRENEWEEKILQESNAYHAVLKNIFRKMIASVLIEAGKLPGFNAKKPDDNEKIIERYSDSVHPGAMKYNLHPDIWIYITAEQALLHEWPGSHAYNTMKISAPHLKYHSPENTIIIIRNYIFQLNKPIHTSNEKKEIYKTISILNNFSEIYIRQIIENFILYLTKRISELLQDRDLEKQLKDSGKTILCEILDYILQEDNNISGIRNREIFLNKIKNYFYHSPSGLKSSTYFRDFLTDREWCAVEPLLFSNSISEKKITAAVKYLLLTLYTATQSRKQKQIIHNFLINNVIGFDIENNSGTGNSSGTIDNFPDEIKKDEIKKMVMHIGRCMKKNWGMSCDPLEIFPLALFSFISKYQISLDWKNKSHLQITDQYNSPQIFLYFNAVMQINKERIIALIENTNGRSPVNFIIRLLYKKSGRLRSGKITDRIIIRFIRNQLFHGDYYIENIMNFRNYLFINTGLINLIEFIKNPGAINLRDFIFNDLVIIKRELRQLFQKHFYNNNFRILKEEKPCAKQRI